MNNIYLILAKLFSSLSLSAFGGGNVILPAIHQAAVGTYHWMTDRQFLDLFSISKAAPGPSTLIVELVGIKAAGFPGSSHFLLIPAIVGAAISVVAIFVPSSVLLFVVAHFWERIQGKPWQITIQKALMPITTGLILSSTWIVGKTAISGWLTGGMACVALFVILRTKINPILIMGVAALVSWMVWG
jgi:chromate transporter